MSAPRERLLVALDAPDRDRVLALVDALLPHVGGFKIGLEAFTAAGPELVRAVRERGAAVFLDLKLHDIPNTVAGAAAAAARLGVSMLTVHAAGGSEMLRRAVEASADAADAAGFARPAVLAVTVLTSLDDRALERIGLAGPCAAAVERLAGVAREAGAGGVVCSPHEVAAVRAAFPGGLRVVPGIRPGGVVGAGDDQTRVAGAADAIRAGATHLVVGRPVTAAPDPAAAAAALVAEIGRGAADTGPCG